MSDTKKDSTQNIQTIAAASSGYVVTITVVSLLILPWCLAIAHGVLRCTNGGNVLDVICALIFGPVYSAVAGIIDYRESGRGYRGAAVIAKELAEKAAATTTAATTTATVAQRFNEEFIRSMQF